MVSRTAARTLCDVSLRTASGPEGSSAQQTLMCAEVHRVAVGLITGRVFSVFTLLSASRLSRVNLYY